MNIKGIGRRRDRSGNPTDNQNARISWGSDHEEQKKLKCVQGGNDLHRRNHNGVQMLG